MDAPDCPTLETVRRYDATAERYLERTIDRELIRVNLERFTDCLPPGGLVLDIGCGPGFDAALLRSAGFRAVGVDLSSAMITLGRERFPGRFVRADMRQLPFCQVADGLWVNASLLHLLRKDVPGTLAQFWTALKHGGILFLTVKDGTGEGWDNRASRRDTTRWFTYWEASALENVVVEAGFETVRVWSNGQWVKCIAKKR